MFCGVVHQSVVTLPGFSRRKDTERLRLWQQTRFFFDGDCALSFWQDGSHQDMLAFQQSAADLVAGG